MFDPVSERAIQIRLKKQKQKELEEQGELESDATKVAEVKKPEKKIIIYRCSRCGKNISADESRVYSGLCRNCHYLGVAAILRRRPQRPPGF